MPDKSTIRHDALARRRALTPEERTAKSSAIAERLFELPDWQNAPEVLGYASKPDEVDTLNIIERLIADRKRVLLPRALPSGDIQWLVVEDLRSLRPGAFDVPEPDESHHTLSVPEPASPVLVPCVAFTPTGDRLGHGKGYFDRFLKNHKGTKIGLAFDLQCVPEIPVEPHDVPLDIVVTETRVYRP